ncbi:FtsZ/tubulin family protein [Flavobacterium algicola]|uniref:hypothetical protein n=1 Tax=Flavobacterium algicola TaxID=556529 RepID=UPI001EFC67DB|nr:hypothetical protein [Flavobacterium algicola]MCG9793388.1 hypothetical protein [Flavobacterium algicola]
MKTNCTSKDQAFTTSRIFELNSNLNYDETLNNVKSYFITESIKNKKFAIDISPTIDFYHEALLLGSIGISSDDNRAIKAIELALSHSLLSEKNIQEATNILLHIATTSTEVTLDEIGEINDYIQIKGGFSADIIMSVGEDENLGEAIAVTIVLCYSDTFKQ